MDTGPTATSAVGAASSSVGPSRYPPPTSPNAASSSAATPTVAASSSATISSSGAASFTATPITTDPAVSSLVPVPAADNYEEMPPSTQTHRLRF